MSSAQVVNRYQRAVILSNWKGREGREEKKDREIKKQKEEKKENSLIYGLFQLQGVQRQHLQQGYKIFGSTA